jgi:hypothetical protein
MKVALCFYGLLGGTKGKAGDRNGSSLDILNLAYPHYKKHILDINNIDVFIHSWDVNLQKEITEKYSPKLSKFESTLNFTIPKPLKNTQRVQNHFSRWYSCKEVNKLKSKYEKDNNFKYDFVMLSRQDIAWQTDVLFKNLDSNYFYVANWKQQFNGTPMGYPYGGYNKSLQDLWCISNSNDMNELCTIFDHISQYCIENPELMGHKGISNHRLLYYKLLKMGFIPDKLKFIFNHDIISKSDMPLVRYKYFNDKT